MDAMEKMLARMTMAQCTRANGRMSFAEGDEGPEDCDDEQDNHTPERCAEADMKDHLTTDERSADPAHAAGGIDIGEKACAILRNRDISYNALSDRDIRLAQSPDKAGHPKQDEIVLLNSEGDDCITDDRDRQGEEKYGFASVAVRKRSEDGRAEELANRITHGIGLILSLVGVAVMVTVLGQGDGGLELVVDLALQVALDERQGTCAGRREGKQEQAHDDGYQLRPQGSRLPALQQGQRFSAVRST